MCSRVVVTLLLWSACVAGAADATFSFEAGPARYSIESDGSSRLEAADGPRQLSSSPAPFATIRRGDTSIAASRIVRRGSTFTATFGDSRVEADFSVTTRSSYFVVELAEVRGNPPDQLCFAQLRPRGLPTSGHLLAVRWSQDWAVSLTSLHDTLQSKLAWPDAIEACASLSLGLSGQRVAIVAVPTAAFLGAIRRVEIDWRLPSPSIAGRWAKQSEDVGASYLLVDLDEANVDEVIRYAKLGHFRYILLYAGTWAESSGSYRINPRHFPGGEAGLRSVIERCHAAGLKVGMHMMTSLVDKRDPLVRPTPHPGLLKDAEGTLEGPLDEAATTISAAGPLSAFPRNASGRRGTDVQIDDEIVHYGAVSARSFVGCVRGYAGTAPASHRPGARIRHLTEGAGAYLADLRGPLKDAIASRVADIIDRCGFDMIFFDGGELNAANGPAWYWVGVQQDAIWRRVRRDLLVQGSGRTHWTWHIFARATCNDYAAIGRRAYMDVHKIDLARLHRNNFVPVDLGWIALLASTNGHPATLPEDLEHEAVRMLALDAAAGLETTVAALRANGRAEEALRLFGRYEQLRATGAVPEAIRRLMLRDEWHLATDDSVTRLHRVHRESASGSVPAAVEVQNPFAEQPLRFRARVRPAHAAPGDRANIALLERPLALRIPTTSTTVGALAARLEFTDTATKSPALPPARPAAGTARVLDLRSHRPLAVTLRVENAPAGSQPATINIQLYSRGALRDHYVDLDFTGEKTVLFAEPHGAERMLSEFVPDAANYAPKAALRDFDYAATSAVNVRWMRVPAGGPVACSLLRVEALAETETTVTNLRIATASGSVLIPRTLRAGDYAESLGDGVVRAFDPDGRELARLDVASPQPVLLPGKNTLSLHGTGQADVSLTVMAVGEGVDITPTSKPKALPEKAHQTTEWAP